MDDVLIIGAGVMGCASALALARRGVTVRVLERSVPGAEASSAAAGILGAQVESHADGPMARLCVASRRRFPEWARDLHERTGIDIGFRSCGVLRVAFDEAGARAIERETAWQSAAGLCVEIVDGARASRIEEALSGAAVGGAHFADDARIDPPSLLKALRIAAERAGAHFQSGAYVRRVLTEGDRARGVTLEDGTTLMAGHVVVAAGSWSTLVGGTTLPENAVVPARGQIVEIALPTPVLSGVVFGPRCYLSPRDDGRVLIGSTLEFVGFQRAVTARAVRDLLAAAIELVPALSDAELGRAWSNFRPYTKDELPLLGATGIAGLSLATGHFPERDLAFNHHRGDRRRVRIGRARAGGRLRPSMLRAFDPPRVSFARASRTQARVPLAKRNQLARALVLVPIQTTFHVVPVRWRSTRYISPDTASLHTLRK